MNIWYVHPYAGGPGLGRFYRPWHLAKAWEKLGATTTVLMADYHHILDRKSELPPENMIDGVRYVALKAGYYEGNGAWRILNMCRFTWSLWRAGARVGRDLPKPDAIIISSPHPFAFLAGLVLARRFRSKLAFEVRDLWPLSIIEINGTPSWHPVVWVTGWIERFAYKRSDLVASLLAGVDSYMRERGMAFRRFVWVPNGFSIERNDRSQPESVEGRHILDVVRTWNKEGRFVIMHPGAMGPPNGLGLLLDAVAVLKARELDKKIGVLLVGDGILRQQLEEQVTRQGLGSVLIAGPLPKSDVLGLLAHCHLGYCGGKRHDKVYRYGISFNKLMDFLSLGIDILMPIPAVILPDGARLPNVLIVEDKADHIAAAIEVKLAEFRYVEGRKHYLTPEVLEHFEYGSVAQRYFQALFPAP